jgi:multimeric flavodoxin WrbA
MIKIIGINSSLREKSNPASQHDSYTRTLLEIGLEHVKRVYEDAKTEIIDLGEFNICPEPGSYSSDENFAQMNFPLTNDDMPLLFEKIIEADGIIFSSPTYWNYPSGLLKTFIDRLIALDEISDDPTKRRVQGKVAGAIVTAKFDGSSRVAQDILSMANYLGFIIPPHAFAFHTGRVTTSVLEDDEEFSQNYFAKRNAQAMLENVYLMAKLVKSKNWKIFQEFIHPLSESEMKGEFNLEEEIRRFKENGNFRDLNKKKGLV